MCKCDLSKFPSEMNVDMHVQFHPASRAFYYSTYALYREKALHESCQVLVEHAQRVAK